MDNMRLRPCNSLPRRIDILKFVIDVIFSAPRRIDLGRVQDPPEAHYQDELYRCCHTHSNGSLVTIPQFGTAEGRVDFYILMYAVVRVCRLKHMNF